ncbi:hypothetical protein [Streptomyces sp. NPDC060243]|uniref:hypothetical protein n=1 Tax=Streptomyces sp. NPDC060243 TaxID=3347081 RepID=UPI00364D0571
MITPATYQADEALRRSVAADLGPRHPGALYMNTDGVFRVLDATLDREEARRLLNRRSAQFAVQVLDTTRPDARPFWVGSVWTSSDVLLKAGV